MRDARNLGILTRRTKKEDKHMQNRKNRGIDYKNEEEKKGERDKHMLKKINLKNDEKGEIYI